MTGIKRVYLFFQYPTPHLLHANPPRLIPRHKMKWMKGDDDGPVITEGQVSEGNPIRSTISRLPWQRWRKGSRSDDIPFLSSDRRFSDDPVTIARQTHAWRVNVKSGAGVALLVLITNICVLIWANASFELQDGSSTVFSGIDTRSSQRCTYQG